jgi:hypothetical protein
MGHPCSKLQKIGGFQTQREGYKSRFAVYQSQFKVSFVGVPPLASSTGKNPSLPS